MREIYGEVLATRERERAELGRRAATVALVHDWLTGMRGGEKVLDAICELYPDATLYTPGPRARLGVAAHRGTAHRRPSFTQRLPGAARFYRHYLPLFPAAVELFDLDGYDLVISSSHCAVKSVVPTGRGRPRLLLPLADALRLGSVRCLLRAGTGRRARTPAAAAGHGGLARWDRATAGRVDRFRREFSLCCGPDPPIL